MRRNSILLLSLLVITWISWTPIRVSAKTAAGNELSEKEARAYANMNNTWVICYQQGIRTSDFYQYDATDTCLYFSYSKHSCVDVYNTEGVFLYSFIFPERQNGTVSIRCENDNVYVCTKDNLLYIFSDDEEIGHMDYAEATKKGYDFFWFDDNQPNILVDAKWIHWLNENGDIIKQISTPSVIKNTMPPSSSTILSMPIVLVLLILLLLVYSFLLKRLKALL